MKCSSHWLENLPADMSIDIIRELAWSHACDAGPYREALQRLIVKDDVKGLCDFQIDYLLSDLTPHSVYNARQVTAFFSKLADLDIGQDKEEAALGTWFEAEARCAETNQLLKMRRNGTLAFPSRVDLAFERARRKIARILGPVPKLEELKLRFGPGSTRKTRKADASWRAKCCEGVTCSEELFPAIQAVLRQLPHISAENADVRVIIGEDESLSEEEVDLVSVALMPSRLMFAPKNVKTHRTIGVYPLMNLIVQLGYGDHMSSRLATFGIDIRDQSVNQKRARHGSLTGEIATLDQKSASDLNSRELVYELCPLDWASALARCRSAKVELPSGSIHVQEKFSAMGNGYTFPLETLIFWALADAVCGGGVTAYGDDICVPTRFVSDVVEVYHYAGFIVNKAKSFATGPFRESCGADFFLGTNVRPFYQKEWISGQSLFKLHNFYMRREDFDRASRVRSFIHPALWIFGPDDFGDGHLIGDHQKSRAPRHEAQGLSGYFFETFTTRSRRELRKELCVTKGDFPAALYSIYAREGGDGDTVGYSAEARDRPIKRNLRVFEAARLSGRLGNFVPKIDEGGTVSADPLTGEPAWSIPGVDGYKKIRVYTLGA